MTDEPAIVTVIPTKPFWQSKTLWMNIISLVLIFLSLTQFQNLIPSTWVPYIALLSAMLNILLRFITTGQVSLNARSSSRPPGSA